MKNDRAMQIKSSLEGLGTEPSKGYTQKEIIGKLIELENALLSAVYEKNHAENMRPQDLTKHFASLAEEFGINNSDVYKRFIANMDELDRTVKSLIAGQRGEYIARSSLKPLTYNNDDIKILYNIELEDEVMKTEYDAIVINPYGIFVIEVKNWRGNVTLTKDGFLERDGKPAGYNLAARMIVRESLLKEVLGDLFPDRYNEILLFPEEKTVFNDEYNKAHFGFGVGIINIIKQFSRGPIVFSSEEIEKIAKTISESSKSQYTYSTVKCDEIINDFASLMAEIEFASCKGEISDEKTLETSDKLDFEPRRMRKKVKAKNEKFKKNVKSIAPIAATLVLGIAIGVACKKIKH